jgi:hypothetical protein
MQENLQAIKDCSSLPEISTSLLYVSDELLGADVDQVGVERAVRP